MRGLYASLRANIGANKIMQKKSKISIILPVYNVAQWLDETVASIQAQTLTEWEAIFVIDGSPDNSQEILQKYAAYDKRIKIITQENKGSGAARDYGVDHATGEYLFFLDPDDLIPTNALKAGYERAVQMDADVVIGDYVRFIDGQAVQLQDKVASSRFKIYFNSLYDKVFTRQDINDEIFYCSLYFCSMSLKLYRRKFWIQYRIRSPEGLTMAEDFIPVWKMCLLSKKICVVDIILLYYRKRLGSATTLRSEKAFDIFTSFMTAKKLYHEMSVSKYENSLMHKWFLQAFQTHMFNYTPYLKFFKFYKTMLKIIKYFDNQVLSSHVIGYSQLIVLKIFKYPVIIGFPLYLFYISMQIFIKRSVVIFLQLLGQILPKFILVSLLEFLQQKNQKIKFSKYSNILNKVIYYLQRKAPNGKT